MPNKHHTLKRGLKNRHVQLIALGGAVGTGLFLGTAGTIKMAGPSVIISYIIGGFIAFLIMRQLGEMMTQEPIAGSFSNLAHKYWGDFPGMASGWNYWILYILVGMSELTAVGKYMQYWFPNMENWQIISIFFLIINIINLLNVKVFGEMEFWFASVKVLAIIGMIIFGSYLIITAPAHSTITIKNLWIHGGFFANGYSGMVLALTIVMFSFGGLELVGIAAAETDTPQKTIPKAINQVLYRILIFYVGALLVLLSLYPWDQLNTTAASNWAEAMAISPFVQIFSNIGINSAANILNLVILTAALSVYNSCVYCNSRMLYGLALQGNAPKLFALTNDRGVPVMSLALSSTATLTCVAINYLIPEEALGVLMSLVVSALLVNWAMISLTHLKFRAQKIKEKEKIIFKAFWYPVSNYLCLGFFLLMLIVLCYLGEIAAVVLIPVWLGFLGIGYHLKKTAEN